MLAKAASVHQSGETNRGGRITKEGRSDLRGVLVEAAWVAVEHHPHWKAQFERLAARIGKQKAIVAIARKLLVTIWHVLSQQEADSNIAWRRTQFDNYLRGLQFPDIHPTTGRPRSIWDHLPGRPMIWR